MSFRMPDSYYDPPEYSFQKQAENVFERGLYGLYDVDPETGDIINYDRVPDSIGTQEEIQSLYASIVKDEPEASKRYIVAELSFEACCDIAESEANEDYYDDSDDRDYYEPEYDDGHY
jgi:hypothetical protein